MLKDNPYKSPNTTAQDAANAARIVRSTLWWLIYLYPVIVIALFYGSWALTTVALGRTPTPYRDYPRNFAIDSISLLAALSFLAGPLLVPAGLAWTVIQPFGKCCSTDAAIRRRSICLGTYLLMLAVAASIWLGDPFEVISWFWD